MKILVTGARGFIGKNLITELNNQGFHNILEFNSDSDIKLLDLYTKKCDFVFHLAGVNRPESDEEFMRGNYDFLSLLINNLIKNKNIVPILFTSSIQAKQDNPYGKSKKAAEKLIRVYGKEHNVPTYIYRLVNVFGKWSKPNYNSVIATFCHNISRDIPITVNNPNTMLDLIYIDDVVKSFINILKNGYDKKLRKDDYSVVNPIYTKKLGYIVELINSFKESRESLQIHDFGNLFVKKLYSTYLSYLPTDGFKYLLKMHVDDRGSFTEFLKSKKWGQLSINIIRKGITKGNHWHHTKNEKFLVVGGCGIVRFRKVGSSKIYEYKVSGEKLEVIDIPVGYTHNIENIGKSDLITVMWVNEVFEKNNPDTFFLEV